MKGCTVESFMELKFNHFRNILTFYVDAALPRCLRRDPLPFSAIEGLVCAFRLRRPQKLGRPGISEGPEKDREGGPDEKSAVRIPPAAIARKCIECI